MTIDQESVLKAIFLHSIQVEPEQIQRTLILYDEPITFLGDCCMRFDKLRYFKAFLNNTAIQVNFSDKKNEKYYNSLLRNNPHVDQISEAQNWEDIDFQQYDAVFCVPYQERNLLDFLTQKYGHKLLNGAISLAVFSLAELFLKREDFGVHIFPVLKGLNTFLNEPRSGELHLTDKERGWADDWLAEKGLLKHEDLYILLDTTTIKGKLLRIDVYFDILSRLLDHENVKVLIFDEKSLGKEDFYREWLGELKASKLIFSRGLSLREDICLLGSTSTRMVFGPCTGLMHCASSIFNAYIGKGLDRSKAPLLVVYTGIHEIETYDVNLWWGASPLVHCLLLKEVHGKKSIESLHELNSKGTLTYIDYRPCTEYNAEILLRFLEQKLAAIRL